MSSFRLRKPSYQPEEREVLAKLVAISECQGVMEEKCRGIYLVLSQADITDSGNLRKMLEHQGLFEDGKVSERLFEKCKYSSAEPDY